MKLTLADIADTRAYEREHESFRAGPVELAVEHPAFHVAVVLRDETGASCFATLCPKPKKFVGPSSNRAIRPIT